MEQRQEVEQHVALVVAEQHRALSHVADRGVGVHHPLRVARRARRVGEHHQLVGADLGRPSRQSLIADGVAGSQHLDPRVIAVGSRLAGLAGAQPHHRLQVAGRFDLGSRLGEQRVVVDRAGAVDGDEKPTLRVDHRVGHVVGPVAGVQRHEAATDLRDGVHQVQPLGPVHHPDRDVVTVLHTDCEQPFGHPVHRRRELGVGLHLIAPIHSRTVAPLGRRPSRKVAQSQIIDRNASHAPASQRSGRTRKRPSGGVGVRGWRGARRGAR